MVGSPISIPTPIHARGAWAWGLGLLGILMAAPAEAQTDAFYGVGATYGGYSSAGYSVPGTGYYSSHGGLYSPPTASYGGGFTGYGGTYYSSYGASYGPSSYYGGMHAGSGNYFGRGYVGPATSYGGNYYSVAPRVTPAPRATPIANSIAPGLRRAIRPARWRPR